MIRKLYVTDAIAKVYDGKSGPSNTGRRHALMGFWVNKSGREQKGEEEVRWIVNPGLFFLLFFLIFPHSLFHLFPSFLYLFFIFISISIYSSSSPSHLAPCPILFLASDD